MVPILRDPKQTIEMLVTHDAKRMAHLVLDRLVHSLNVGLQVR